MTRCCGKTNSQATMRQRRANMKVLVDTNKLSMTEWLLQRRAGIGGSDASIVLGLNKYKTAFELWLDKTGQVIPESEPSEAAYWGTQMEEVVAKEFEKRTGKKVRRSNRMYQHSKYNFILANIDRFVVGEDAILECKTASAYLLKEWEADEVPAPYLVQIQHYLAVTGKSKAYIAVLIGGNKFIWKEIDRDEELINQITAHEIHFWEEYVIGETPPPSDGSSAAEKFLKERFAKAESGQTIQLNKSVEEQLKYREQLKEDKKIIETQIKEIENGLMNTLQTAEFGYSKSFEVAWKNVTSNRADTKLLREKFPEIYKQVLKESNSRRLTIKEIG